MGQVNPLYQCCFEDPDNRKNIMLVKIAHPLVPIGPKSYDQVHSTQTGRVVSENSKGHPSASIPKLSPGVWCPSKLVCSGLLP